MLSLSGHALIPSVHVQCGVLAIVRQSHLMHLSLCDCSLSSTSRHFPRSFPSRFPSFKCSLKVSSSHCFRAQESFCVICCPLMQRKWKRNGHLGICPSFLGLKYIDLVVGSHLYKRGPYFKSLWYGLV